MRFGRIPSSESKVILNPRLPQILFNIVFLIDFFYSFILSENLRSRVYCRAIFSLTLPGLFEGISLNGYLQRLIDLLKIA